MSDITLLILTFAALAFLLRVDFIFYIVYVLAGLYFWSRWYPPHALKRIRFQRQFTDHAFFNERVAVTLHFYHEGRLPLPWLQVAESVPIELSLGRKPSYALSLKGRECATFTYYVQATRRGYYRLGPLYLHSGDLFGWADESAKAEASYLTVYPRIIPLTELGLPSRLPFGTIASQQRLFEDPARPLGVREYRSGDSLRQINWKVSAHGNNLVVKTLQPAISLETAILLNLNKLDFDRKTRYSAPEWAIEVAASLATHLIEQKQAVGLTTNGIDPLLPHPGKIAEGLIFDDVSGRLLAKYNVDGLTIDGSGIPAPIPPRNGRAHLMKILELLARVEVGATVPLHDVIPRACLNLSWGVTVPVITSNADEVVCQALHRLVRSGLNPILILVTPTHRFAEIRERARQLGFNAYHITEKKELDVWRRPVFRKPG